MKQNPFVMSPNADLFFLTDSLQATLRKINYVINERQGLTVVYGDVGLGKTTLTQYLYESYSADDDYAVAYIPTPNVSTEPMFLRTICGEFGIEQKRSMAQQETALKVFLTEKYKAGQNAVLIVDEAQKIPGKVLEVVRTILNLDTKYGKLMQIVLCGQLELRDRLRDPSKKALRSRIFLTSTLDQFTLEEAIAMVAYRCERVGRENPFVPDTLEEIWTKSKGVPREIIKRCSASWEAAKSQKLAKVPIEAAQFVESDVEQV